MIDLLTRKNRPRMAGIDDAHEDDTAPEGLPFRPLYDDRILFGGQPIALVVAEESEIARFLGLASAVADIGRVVR